MIKSKLLVKFDYQIKFFLSLIILLSQSSKSYLYSAICRQIKCLPVAWLVFVQLCVQGFAAPGYRNVKTTTGRDFSTCFKTLQQFLTPCSPVLIPETLAVAGIWVK